MFRAVPEPYFCIVIPTKNRPELLRNALVSALNQDFESREILVSDNCNDDRTQEVIRQHQGHPALRWIRTSHELNMPDHWDYAVAHARGKYIIILTDRMVMKQGALSAIHQSLKDKNEPGCAVWRWSNYDEGRQIEIGDNRFDRRDSSLETSLDILHRFVSGYLLTAYELPRGLNCCVSSELYSRLYETHGKLFVPLSPDYSFAFRVLSQQNNVLRINRALSISCGSDKSNGALQRKGIDTGYMASLGLDLENAFNHVPLDIPLVENSIFQDFMSARESIKGHLELVELNLAVYFTRCLQELSEKREAGLIDRDTIARWEEAIEECLADHPEVESAVRHWTVKPPLKGVLSRIASRPPRKTVEGLTTSARAFLKRSSARKGSPLEIAGF